VDAGTSRGAGDHEVALAGEPHPNLFEYAAGSPACLSDPTGLYPEKDLATTLEAWKRGFDTKPVVRGKVYDRGGTTTGQTAADTLKAYGETYGITDSYKPKGKVRWMQGPDAKNPTAEKARFIYTKKGGWLDMAHFLFYAGRALQAKEFFLRSLKMPGSAILRDRERLAKFGQYPTYLYSSAEWATRDAMNEAHMQEQHLDSKASSYSYEDIPSDWYGADFAARVFDPNSTKTLSEQVEAYIQTLQPVKPWEAPNWATVPEGTPNEVVPPQPKNYTTTPMFTTP
jgi:hypothetical protein